MIIIFPTYPKPASIEMSKVQEVHHVLASASVQRSLDRMVFLFSLCFFAPFYLTALGTSFHEPFFSFLCFSSLVLGRAPKFS